MTPAFLSRVAARSTPEYAAEFDAYLGGRRPAAALQTDLAADGGYLAPPQVMADVVRGLATKSWLRTLCTVHAPTAAPKVIWPKQLAPADGFVWSTEIAPPTPDAGTRVGTFVQTPHPLTGEFEVSADLLRAVPSLPEFLAEEIARRAGDAEEPAFLTGNGAGRPLGLFTPDAAGVGTDRDVTADPSLYDTWRLLKFQLRSPYLRSGSLRWVLHPNAARLVAGIKSTDGVPLWRPAQRPGDPDSLDGVPVAYSDNAPAGTGPNGTYLSGDYFALLGDLSFYSIQDGVDLSVTRLADSTYGRRNVVGWLVRRKVDGCPRVGEAFLQLKKQ